MQGIEILHLHLDTQAAKDTIQDHQGLFPRFPNPNHECDLPGLEVVRVVNAGIYAAPA